MIKKPIQKFIVIFFSLCLLQSMAFAQEETTTFNSEYTQLNLVADVEAIQSSKPFKVFLEFDLAEGWYTYGDPPGDAGLPVTVDWILPPEFEAGKIGWPPVETYKNHGLTSFGYSNKTSLPIMITPSKEELPKAVKLKARVSWLICNSICIPESAELSLSLPTMVLSD